MYAKCKYIEIVNLVLIMNEWCLIWTSVVGNYEQKTVVIHFEEYIIELFQQICR